MVAALDRVSELTAIEVGQIELGAVPRRRVIELARYGMAGKAPFTATSVPLTTGSGLAAVPVVLVMLAPDQRGWACTACDAGTWTQHDSTTQTLTFTRGQGGP